MAVGQYDFPIMHSVAGVRLGAASAGIKTVGRKDTVLIELSEGSRTSGVFTQNAFCAAPVTLCKQHMPIADTRYLLINSGNANACTGDEGLSDAKESCKKVAELTQTQCEQTLPFSTGVIGERLPLLKLVAAIPVAINALDTAGWAEAAQGIMTTDTRPKGASVQVDVEGEIITVTGIAKGSGMIHPNMATMLAYIATDAAVAQSILDELVKSAADASFNRITVDGDTSTNDSCMLMATGQSKLPEIVVNTGGAYDGLKAAVVEVLTELAKNIVADGEGATKFVTVDVIGGTSSEECLQVAYAVAKSPLVKTALFASDPNWGRIVAAIGYAGVRNLNSDIIKVWLDDVLIVESGGRATSYSEDQGQAVMDQERIGIRIDLARGNFQEHVWTTDLSHDYVTINAEYRT